MQDALPPVDYAGVCHLPGCSVIVLSALAVDAVCRHAGRQGTGAAAAVDHDRGSEAAQLQQRLPGQMRADHTAAQLDLECSEAVVAAGANTRMPSAAELRAELMAARKVTNAR